ncbi:MAG: class I SAM-dependent methyltransferase [Candidatus Bathyarchaeota archaeon]|nr:class I SAM-dependent methyltransferase [Candidatus Bathyarchaeota archaeon]MDH5733213.1 class I SAM-dependent methyltransferase [Candidatus Bathyarchaeota archaeon]
MTPLYTFLKYCENSKLEKEILDCGAGGKKPPLYIFHLFGYKTHGVDISEEQLRKAHEFCKEKRIDLDIRKGDMRNLPFEDCSISFVYSYDTIFHMPKKEISIAMEEMKRVLKKEGLLFVNFVSTEHSGFGKGEIIEAGEFLQNGRHEKVHISYYEDDAPDQYFNGLAMLCKEKRIMEFTREGARALGFNVDRKKHVYASLDYVARKK